MDVNALSAFGLVAFVGAIFGLIGGFLGGADRLVGTFLIGAIGGIALSAIFAFAGWPGIYAVDDYSLVWGAAGGLVLGWAVSRSN